jgi:PAS domain S-box-containing protein
MTTSVLQDTSLATVLDAAPIAMLVVDQHSRILFSNKQASATFGYSADELQGSQVERLIPARMRYGHHRYVSQFFGSPNHRVMGVGREVIGVDSRGREMPLEVGLTPLQTSSGMLAIAAVIDITERRRRETESALARIVQSAMLPADAPGFPGVEFAARSEPADAAGGDFYDYIPLSGGRLAVVIGDASGHGFAAALVTVAARSYLRACSSVEGNVSRILSQVNSLLLKDGLDGRFVTLFYASIDRQDNRITYAGAGHTGYLLAANGDVKRQLASTGPPLGWFPDADYPCEQLAVAPGDVLLLLTDGIEEAMSPSGEQFGRERLLTFVREHIQRSTAEIARQLHLAVHQYQGTAGQHDDATVVIAKFKPKHA